MKVVLNSLSIFIFLTARVMKWMPNTTHHRQRNLACEAINANSHSCVSYVALMAIQVVHVCVISGDVVLWMASYRPKHDLSCKVMLCLLPYSSICARAMWATFWARWITWGQRVFRMNRQSWKKPSLRGNPLEPSAYVTRPEEEQCSGLKVVLLYCDVPDYIFCIIFSTDSTCTYYLWLC